MRMKYKKIKTLDKKALDLSALPYRRVIAYFQVRNLSTFASIKSQP